MLQTRSRLFVCSRRDACWNETEEVNVRTLCFLLAAAIATHYAITLQTQQKHLVSTNR